MNANARSLSLQCTVAISLMLAACSDGGSSTPTQPRVQPPPQPRAAGWNLTQRFASVTGPDNCWVRQQRATWTGAVFTMPLRIVRTGASEISLHSDFFEVDYYGTVTGNVLAASGGPLPGGGTTCGGTSHQQLPSVSELRGEFSADGLSLTATEVNTYELTSGGHVEYTWDWTATHASND